MTLAEAQTKVCLQIDDFLTSYNNGYFTFMGHQWDCNTTSKTNIVGTCVLALANGGNLPAGAVWRDYANVNVPVTGQFMIGIGVQMFTFLSGNYNISWIHKQNVRALTTVDAVLAYDYDGDTASPAWLDPNVQH